MKKKFAVEKSLKDGVAKFVGGRDVVWSMEYLLSLTLAFQQILFIFLPAIAGQAKQLLCVRSRSNQSGKLNFMKSMLSHACLISPSFHLIVVYFGINLQHDIRIATCFFAHLFSLSARTSRRHSSTASSAVSPPQAARRSKRIAWSDCTMILVGRSVLNPRMMFSL
jgi:hypothetical protein